jgi:hypothetical protein
MNRSIAWIAVHVFRSPHGVVLCTRVGLYTDAECSAGSTEDHVPTLVLLYMRRGPQALAGWLDAGRPEGQCVGALKTFVVAGQSADARRWCSRTCDSLTYETMSCSPVSVKRIKPNLFACLDHRSAPFFVRTTSPRFVGRRYPENIGAPSAASQGSDHSPLFHFSD